MNTDKGSVKLSPVRISEDAASNAEKILAETGADVLIISDVSQSVSIHLEVSDGQGKELWRLLNCNYLEEEELHWIGNLVFIHNSGFHQRPTKKGKP